MLQGLVVPIPRVELERHGAATSVSSDGSTRLEVFKRLQSGLDSAVSGVLSSCDVVRRGLVWTRISGSNVWRVLSYTSYLRACTGCMVVLVTTHRAMAPREEDFFTSVICEAAGYCIVSVEKYVSFSRWLVPKLSRVNDFQMGPTLRPTHTTSTVSRRNSGYLIAHTFSSGWEFRVSIPRWHSPWDCSLAWYCSKTH